MTQQIGQNMILVNSSFRNSKSFTLIPATSDAPYVEAMFDPSSSILAIISKVMKQSFHMIPRLDDNGDPIKLKTPNQQTGKVIKEKQISVDTFSEFYLTDKEDIDAFIKLFAINVDNFDYKQFFVDTKKTKVSKLIVPGQ